MKTGELIDNLSANLAPVPRHAVLMRFVYGIGAGSVVSFVAMWAWLGPRPDLGHAMSTFPYWLKFAYTLALAGFSFWAADRLARPGSRAREAAIGVLFVIAALFVIATWQWMGAQPPQRLHLMMGKSANVCPWRIVFLSLPILAGAFWSLRGLAPTRLALAGAVAGFASGALGAWIYAFHCDESAAPFLLIFYTLGIALVAALGAAFARNVLRW